jgi:hypothetical protein
MFDFAAVDAGIGLPLEEPLYGLAPVETPVDVASITAAAAVEPVSPPVTSYERVSSRSP